MFLLDAIPLSSECLHLYGGEWEEWFVHIIVRILQNTSPAGQHSSACFECVAYAVHAEGALDHVGSTKQSTSQIAQWQPTVMHSQ